MWYGTYCFQIVFAVYSFESEPESCSTFEQLKKRTSRSSFYVNYHTREMNKISLLLSVVTMIIWVKGIGWKSIRYHTIFEIIDCTTNTQNSIFPAHDEYSPRFSGQMEDSQRILSAQDSATKFRSVRPFVQPRIKCVFSPKCVYGTVRFHPPIHHHHPLSWHLETIGSQFEHSEASNPCIHTRLLDTCSLTKVIPWEGSCEDRLRSHIENLI